MKYHLDCPAQGNACNTVLFAVRPTQIVDAMRKEDIIEDKEMAALKYFIVSLHRPNSVLALLPGFLVSGKIQASVKTAWNFAKQNDELIKQLVAVDAWGKEDEKGAGWVGVGGVYSCRAWP